MIGFKDKILIVIVFYKSENEILKCLQGISEQSENLSVLIYLNSTIDPSIKRALLNMGCLFEGNGKNIGFSKAVNQGYDYAISNGYEYVTLINPDIVITDRHLVSKLLCSAEETHHSAILSPMHHQCTNKLQLDPKFEKYIQHLTTYPSPNSNLAKCKFVNAAFWFIPMPIIKKVGGFDPIFFLYGEDANFAERVNQLGFSIVVDKQAIVYHCRNSKISGLKHYYYNILGYLWHTLISSDHSLFNKVNTLTKRALSFIKQDITSISKVSIVLFIFIKTIFHMHTLHNRQELYLNVPFLSEK